MSNDEHSQADPTNPPAPVQPKPKWGWILGGIIILWAILMIVFVPRSGLEKPDLSKTAPQSTKVDFNWSLADLEGKPVPFSEFKGKTVFLNFWATWCGPCIQELPSIDALVNNRTLGEVVFLGVSVDDDAADIKRFIASQSPKFTVLRPFGAIPDQFMTEGIPATFIISPDGEVMMSHVGSADWNSPEVIALLQRLSREASSQ